MPTTYNYAGERLDSQTGLLYDNFRYYDPLTGQYVRSDNVQDNSSGMDPYAYVGDNPETRNDLSGHCPWCITALIGAGIGLVVGIVSEASVHGTKFSQYNWGHVGVDAAVGGVAGLLLGTGVGIPAAIGMIAGGATSLIGAVGHKSAGEVLQRTFEGAAIGGIVGGLTGLAGGSVGLSGRLMLNGITRAGVGLAIKQGLLQAGGGMGGDAASQLWDSWRTGGNTQFNFGEMFAAGGISFATGFLGQWAYNHWQSPFWESPDTSSRWARQLDRDANWFWQNIWGNATTGATQIVTQAVRSSAPGSDDSGWTWHGGYTP